LDVCVKKVLFPILLLGRAVRNFVRLIRDGEDDVRGTYPDQHKTTGEEAAVQGSAFTSTMGVGHP
jgi:hypothetical protein